MAVLFALLVERILLDLLGHEPMLLKRVVVWFPVDSKTTFLSLWRKHDLFSALTRSMSAQGVCDASRDQPTTPHSNRHARIDFNYSVGGREGRLVTQ